MCIIINIHISIQINTRANSDTVSCTALYAILHLTKLHYQHIIVPWLASFKSSRRCNICMKTVGVSSISINFQLQHETKIDKNSCIPLDSNSAMQTKLIFTILLALICFARWKTNRSESILSHVIKKIIYVYIYHLYRKRIWKYFNIAVKCTKERIWKLSRRKGTNLNCKS